MQKKRDHRLIPFYRGVARILEKKEKKYFGKKSLNNIIPLKDSAMKRQKRCKKNSPIWNAIYVTVRLFLRTR